MKKTKICSTCKICKKIDKFYRDSRTNDGHVSQCKQCRESYALAYEASREDASSQKKWRLKNEYGITLEEEQKILVSQSYKCAICQTRLEKPYLDHSHVTGKVRGMLCLRCNWLLGQCKDDRVLLNAAIDYLEKYENT